MLAKTYYEKIVLDDHINRRVNDILHNGFKPLPRKIREKLFGVKPKIYYIQESKKVVKARIEDDYKIFLSKVRLRLYK